MYSSEHPSAGLFLLPLKERRMMSINKKANTLFTLPENLQRSQAFVLILEANLMHVEHSTRLNIPTIKQMQMEEPGAVYQLSSKVQGLQPGLTWGR